MNISLITSLYRSERFLPEYIKRLLDTGSRVVQAQLLLEVIIVANEATPSEQEMIDNLAQSAQTFVVRSLYVPRESLYASWNRAIRTSSGKCIGMWNVDDDRKSEALIDGYRLISGGCDLVDFPYTLIQVRGEDTQRQDYKAFPYDVDGCSPLARTRTGPFFMYARELYDRTGPFDERFKVCGDVEWTARASAAAKFCSGTVHAGAFYIHGKNLSTGDLLAVEENIVQMLHPDKHHWEGLKPANPKLMKATWMLWQTHKLPLAVGQQLWGRKAIFNYHIRDKMHMGLRNRLSIAITKSGLRPFLANIGIVKSKTPPLAK